jgi:2-polyprenyl-3-methyl-5-hydroxy-6-metoxy-1,4-benzoquinol methylase
MGGSGVWGRTYAGLPIKADYRVHEVAFELITRSFGSLERLRVLDVATGSGAFAERLIARFPGWTVEINDFESEALVNGLRKRSVDLNAAFAEQFDGEGYDLVVAIETLEHLENPWHFLREVRKLLRPGGMLVLSTPNVDSTLDRLTYLVEGHPY